MGTVFWTEAIEKYMNNVQIYSFLYRWCNTRVNKKVKIRPGWKYIGLHIIFYIKIYVKFTRKARLVGDGQKTKAPSSITHSIVVSSDSVQLSFTISYINDLDICACDIGNALLNVNCGYKLFSIDGVEFGSENDPLW